MRPGGNHQRGVGVAKIVGAEAGEPASSDGGPEDAMAEVVVVEELTARGGEDEPELVRLPREQLATQHVFRGAREVDPPARRACLHGTSSPR
jgi:hypothetical protein